MNSPDPILKLRLAPEETVVEELVHRSEREQRALTRQREDDLATSLAPFRVGSVPYLNAVPLTRGLEDQILFLAPSKLGDMLRRDELEAGLVSVTEVLFHDRYDILDGIAIASLGEVKSVFLAHQTPLADLKVVYCDPASLTSVCLLRVLLAEQEVWPEFKPLLSYDRPALPQAVLLIGDPALDFQYGPHDHQIWDLGAAWFELTKLPFVYAVWALRRGVENQRLRRQLRAAKDFGLDTLDSIISSRIEYDYDFRKDYLSWHVHYHFGADEKRGLARFAQLLEKHQLGRVCPVRFVV